jgi:phosphatidylserine decarboxylase
LIAVGGRALVGIAASAAAISAPFYVYASIGFIGLTLFLVFVFRDPRRKISDGIVSPADGKVREVDAERGVVSIYLALRNVHVTRSPLDGLVEKTSHLPGSHRPAFSKKTTSNERFEISLKSAIGDISMIQMTGALARRIVPYVKDGQQVGRGEKLSLIRFGSRVDVLLPPAKARITVSKGQRLRAGVTIIAEVSDDKPQ